MAAMLDITISRPLEREYEAWIAHAIEEYFNALRVPVKVWAISPFDERTWPADLGVIYPAKLIGLQVKRPFVAPPPYPGTPVGFDRLKWSLSSPKGQSALVAAIDCIYYCLPCFLNREYRAEILSHCVFWKPNSTPPSQVWYDNPKARSSPDVSDEMRWGYFIELARSCDIGHYLLNDQSTKQFFDYLRAHTSDLRHVVRSEVGEGRVGTSFATYFVAIPPQAG